MTAAPPLSSHRGVICGMCGCDNASHLVFCQECGQRLGPRVAAPTPAIGMSTSPAPSPAPAPVSAASVSCNRCGATNQPGIRYCVTCGNTLIAKAAEVPKGTIPITPGAVAAAAAAARPEPQAAPPVPTPVMPAPPITPAAVYRVEAAPVAAPRPAIAPRPVEPAGAGKPQPSPANLAVTVSPSSVQTPGTRACPRCRGSSDEAAQFCRFCGASLGPAAQAAAPPAAAPAPAAVQAPAPSPVVATPVDVARANGAGIATPIVPPPPDNAEARPTGSPPAKVPTYGRIVVITKEGGEGASYPLTEQLDIGRSQGDVLIPDDHYLSPRHVRIVRRTDAAAPRKPATFALVDLASTNGIYLRLSRDGGREVPLEDQDLFLAGQQVLKFEIVRDAEEGLAHATQHGTLLFGTPASRRYARISQRTVEGVARDVFHVQKSETVIGRESGDVVFTDDPFLSRRHAAIKFDNASRRFVLNDLGSSNGTFIQIRGEVTIKSGDQFRVGQQLFRVDLSAAPAP